jgi:hypothetical protein
MKRRTLGEVTKRDFVALASILCKNGSTVGEKGYRLLEDLNDYFQSQNPRFDRARFATAATKCRR